MLRRLPIRLRLTIAFASVMALVLVATGAFVWLRVGASLDRSVNEQLRTRSDDVDSLPRATGSSPEPHEFAAGEAPAELLSLDGAVLRATPHLGRPLLTRAELARASRGRISLDRTGLPGLAAGRWRLLATPVETPGGRAVAVVAASLEPREETLDRLVVQLLLGGLGALLLASLAGYALATAALRPVEAMSRKAAELSLTGGDRRLPVPPTGDEIAHLGERLNDLLARVEAAVSHERRFLGDASHELRTPLAVLKAELELALRRPRSREELEDVLRSAKEETDRLERLAEDLLVVAASDHGGLALRCAPCSARELLDGVSARFEARARADGRRIVVHAPQRLEVPCDRARVDQALGNLVENALRHGGGAVTLEARTSNGSVELRVSDAGAGFPPGFLPQAFERFSRADEGRSAGGSGLGLAIVDAIARAHGGSAGARNGDGGGSEVWIALPRSTA